MRRFAPALFLLTLAALAPPAEARQGQGGPPAPAAQRHVYQLGLKSVAIPPPAGFAEALSQSDLVATVMTGSESPNNEVLASHIPSAELERLKRGEPVEFSFYTKVSVLKMAKAHEMSEAEFAAVVSQFEAASPELFDVNGPIIRETVKRMEGSLSAVAGGEVKLELAQPQNLGSFEKTKDVYSAMMLMTLKGEKGPTPLLGTLSMVRLKGRMLFFYTYRKFISKQDAEVLRDFTRGWIKEVVAANRPAPN
jgi:hypothetical protein